MPTNKVIETVLIVENSNNLFFLWPDASLWFEKKAESDFTRSWNPRQLSRWFCIKLGGGMAEKREL